MLLRRSAANQSPRSARGFVLLEVLVAVGVAAIIMTALLRSFTSTWAGINAVREDAESMLLARALLADGSSTKIAAGSQNGTVGRYAWNMTAVVVPVAPPPPSPSQQQQQQQQPGQPQQPQQANGDDQQQPNPFGLYRITLVITAPSGRSSSLETYRIGPAASQ